MALMLRVAVGALSSGISAFEMSLDISTAHHISCATTSRCKGRPLVATKVWVAKSNRVGGLVPPGSGFQVRCVLCGCMRRWCAHMALQSRPKMRPHSSGVFTARVKKRVRICQTSSFATGFGLGHHTTDTTISRTHQTGNAGKILGNKGAEATQHQRSRS